MSERIVIQITPKMEKMIRDLRDTCLFGDTLPDVARRLIEEGLQSKIRDGLIKRIL